MIVTTLQKLNTAISKPQYLAQMEKLRDERIIFIFDECHRSQFGDTHRRITEFFRNHQMFGFTGTPIFAENAAPMKAARTHKAEAYGVSMAAEDPAPYRVVEKAGSGVNRTTKDLFHKKLHSYVITDYIIEHHPVKTRNKEFTAMMCVSSVDVLIKYYELFAKRKAEGKHKLKIATIFSYTSNEEDKDADGILDEGGEIIGGEGGNPHTREKLDGFISDYNGMFGTNFSTKEKASILADVDFELELIHRDVINVQYILTLLASLYDADEADQADIRKLILDSVAGDIELRSKRELIQKFIDSNLPKLDSSAEIPDSFEDFWKKERVAAFDKLVKEEQLDADKLKQVIDRYVYTGQEPLPDPDIVELIQKPLGILERGPTRKRVLDKVVDYVATFIRGVAA